MTRENFKPFLSWTYDREIVIERVGIINELVRFVTDGAYDQWYRRPHEKTSTVTNAVAAAIQPALIPLMKKIPRSWKATAAGDTAELLIASFKEGQRYSNADEFLSCPPFRDETLVNKFCAAFDTTVTKHWLDAKPSVKGAYEKAMENLTVSDTRLVSMYAIIQLLRQNDYHSISLEGFDEIGQAIRLQRAYFKSNVATFGGLLGGQAARDVIKMLARDCCHKEDADDINYSVIHFLCADSRPPGSWGSDVEEKFRADIKKCYDALGSK